MLGPRRGVRTDPFVATEAFQGCLTPRIKYQRREPTGRFAKSVELHALGTLLRFLVDRCEVLAKRS